MLPSQLAANKEIKQKGNRAILAGNRRGETLPIAVMRSQVVFKTLLQTKTQSHQQNQQWRSIVLQFMVMNSSLSLYGNRTTASQIRCTLLNDWTNLYDIHV